VVQDGNLRQCAVYGLGVAAQHQRAAFAQVAQPAVAALMAVIRKPGAREEDNAMATENAVGALGKVRCVAGCCLHWMFKPVLQRPCCAMSVTSAFTCFLPAETVMWQMAILILQLGACLCPLGLLPAGLHRGSSYAGAERH